MLLIWKWLDGWKTERHLPLPLWTKGICATTAGSFVDIYNKPRGSHMYCGNHMRQGKSQGLQLCYTYIRDILANNRPIIQQQSPKSKIAWKLSAGVMLRQPQSVPPCTTITVAQHTRLRWKVQQSHSIEHSIIYAYFPSAFWHRPTPWCPCWSQFLVLFF